MSLVFKYIERGYNSSLLLIPGWAADYRVFSKLGLPYNYILPAYFSPFDFNKHLLKELKEKGIKKISVFGWSLGGFLASSLCSENRELIDKVFLVSIRRKYEKDKLDSIRLYLKKNKSAYLYRFYSQCFPYKMDRWFKEHILKNYCRELDLNYLLEGLDYLEESEIKPDFLKEIGNIKIIHGVSDRIAPLNEAVWLSEKLPNSSFIAVGDAGHMPFLKENFKEII